MMNIGIDARKIRDFGIGTYIDALIRHIPECDPQTTYTIFHYPQDEDIIPRTGDNITLAAETSPKYSIRELTVLPLKMVMQRLDLFHAPHYTLPPLRPCKGVVTIHDVIHLRFPEYLPHPAAFYYAKAMMWAAARSAKNVITVSECSKRDIVRFLGVPEEKVEVVYNGIQPPGVSGELKNKRDVHEHFGMSRPYILYLGNFMPHKNLETLITAYSLFKQRCDLPHCLVLAGKNEKMQDTLTRLITEEHLEQDVILTGFVETEWVPALYQNAEMFVYPSLYEGFGLQALEAMAHHVPVAVSNVAALPEIAGDAAIRFDPESAESIAEALSNVLTDQELRETLIERGNARLRHFSWQETARKTVEIYQSVMRQGE